MPSVRFTMLPLASCATNVRSREALMFWAILSSMKSQLFSSHLSEPGARYSGFSTRRAEIASCIDVAPFGQRRPSLIGLFGSPSIWSSLTSPLLSFLVYAIRLQPTAQYGQIEWASVAPSIRSAIFTLRTGCRSKPRALAPPITPSPATVPAPILRTSRRVSSGIGEAWYIPAGGQRQFVIVPRCELFLHRPRSAVGRRRGGEGRPDPGADARPAHGGGAPRARSGRGPWTGAAVRAARLLPGRRRGRPYRGGRSRRRVDRARSGPRSP